MMEQGGLLQIHAEWAARIRANPMTECPIQMSEAGVVWLMCPTLAKDIFSLLEAEDQLPKPPVTHQVLLREALTSVNGSEWKKQRPEVMAAIGGGMNAQERRHKRSVDSAVRLAMRLLRRGTCDEASNEPLVVPDIIDWASKVSARGIVSALLGPMLQEEEDRAIISLSVGQDQRPDIPTDNLSRPSISDRMEMEHLIISFLRSSRRPVGKRDKEQCDRLRDLLYQATKKQVSRCFQHKMLGGPSEEPSDSLMMRLTMRPELSEEVVAANSNSILLAGVETTYTLLGCTLIHLAQKELIQESLRQKAGQGQGSKLMSAVLKETLRINPPVMGLPRVVDCPGGISLVRRVSDEKFTVTKGKVEMEEREGVSYYLNQGAFFAVDVLSAAHGKPLLRQDNGKTNTPIGLLGCCLQPSYDVPDAPQRMIDASSWEFSVPLDDASQQESAKKDDSCPFGIGSRSCPAGSLSVYLAREVIQSLVSGGYHWRLTHKEIDNGWLQRTRRVPTLIIDGPVSLTFLSSKPNPI